MKNEILTELKATGYTKSQGKWIANQDLELTYSEYVERQKQMGLDWILMEDFILGGPF